MSKRVCIIQPVLKQYREAFFLGLENELASSDIKLQVVYGEPWPEEAMRGDNTDLPKPLGHKVSTYRLFRKLFIQPTLLPWLKADLVVLEPANKHVLNYLLILLHSFGLKRIAYWGHGYDRQTSPSTFGNRFKRRILHWVDWWFAYTKGAADYIAGEGFDPLRLTTVVNAIDTCELRLQLENIEPADCEKLRTSIGWNEKSRIAVFCGSLYTNKKLNFLFEAAELIYASNSNFRLLILGGGPLEDEVQKFVSTHTWAHYVGPAFGQKKATMLKLAEFWLNPGLVGLGILDSFCAGLPVITTNINFHSPEIEYMENGFNGLMVEADVKSYADAALNLLNDDHALMRLKQGALISADHYNVEKMVSNFADGVRKCLGTS